MLQYIVHLLYKCIDDINLTISLTKSVYKNMTQYLPLRLIESHVQKALFYFLYHFLL